MFFELTVRNVRKVPEKQLLLHLQEAWENLKGMTDKNDIPVELTNVLLTIIKGHENVEIEVYATCCLAEIFRLLNPQLPVTDEKILQNILEMYLKILVEYDTDGIVEKQIRLLMCLGESDGLLRACKSSDGYMRFNAELFDIVFYLVGNEKFDDLTPPLNALSCLIRQLDRVPEELLNVILFFELELGQDEIHLMQRTFADNLIAANKSAIKFSLEEIYFDFFILGVKKKNFKYYQHSHEFILQFMKSNYDIVQNIIPMLEERLKSTCLRIRVETIHTLGKVFQSNRNVARNNKALWNKFLDRFFDANPIAVKAAIKTVTSIISVHHDLQDDLMSALLRIQNINNAQIRKQIVCCLAELVDENIENMLASSHFWMIICRRINDEYMEISHRVLEILGNIYDEAMKDSLIFELSKDNIKWIRQAFCDYYLRSATDHKVYVERVFYLKLVPYHLDPLARMSRLLEILISVSPVGFEAFTKMQTDQFRARKAFNEWFELLKGSGLQAEMNILVQELSKYFPSCFRVSEHLRTLGQAILKNETLFSEFESLTKHITLSERISLSKIIYSQFSEHGTLGDFVSLLLQRISMVLIDSTSIQLLMHIIDQKSFEEGTQDGNNDAVNRGLDLLKVCAACFPHEFFGKEVLTQLANFINVNPTIIMTCLTLLSIFPEVHQHFMDVSTTLNIKCSCLNYIKNGPINMIKPALRLLTAYFSDNKTVTKKIIEIMKNNLGSANPSEKMFGIIVLAHGAGHIRDLEGKKAVKFVLEVLFNYHVNDPHFRPNLDWCQETELPMSVKLKMCSIKALINWLLYLNDESMVLNHLTRLIFDRRRILTVKTNSRAYFSWIQLSVGCAILKINNYKDVKNCIFHRQYIFLAECIMSSGEPYQEIILKKLTKYMMRDLPFEFIGLYSLFFINRRTPIKTMAILSYCSVLRNRTDKIRSIQGDPRRKEEEIDEQILGNALLYSISTLSNSRLLELNNELSFNSLKRVIEIVLNPLFNNDEFSYSYYSHILNRFKNLLDLQINIKVARRLCHIASEYLTSSTLAKKRRGQGRR